MLFLAEAVDTSLLLVDVLDLNLTAVEVAVKELLEAFAGSEVCLSKKAEGEELTAL